MGIIYVPVIVRNPADRDRSWEGRFMVDTGATDTLIPRATLDAIGITALGQREYSFADGSDAIFDIAIAEIEFMGEIVGSTIVFADADTVPLLGVTALESAGIEVDPRNETLKKLQSVPLK